ncbi:PREDICTED: uncharacterized protein LOC108772024 [Cyphomyrmex costatus]|uniref:uncharacterized protein LOC108772024 n=1 Tax=Cyphomyrmex costatus TaxID=456900 RepID=UPI000852216B|nr:PREDICTED: uncharacterized protein LOC108772024 [Cyphomyrmex costatus]
MGRIYKRKADSSAYFKYSTEQLENAIAKCRKGERSIRKIAEEYEVPFSTIRDKLKNKHVKKHGHPCELSSTEETTVVEALKTAGSWGFPLTVHDLRNIVQMYLTQLKRQTRFKNNRPGRDWVASFFKRHADLSLRLSENIKRCRAKVDDKIINNYFDNLEISLNGIPPSNIINYDETNFSDDPGSVEVIVKRGTNHPERIIDSSKSSTSVMFAATGDGILLPPYTVYKAKNLYPTWVEGGITGARYNRNESGWFDMNIFEDWFMTICLPFLKKLPGKKALIGDNLPSHISQMVISQCQENDIGFILLPPNSTHLTQPLDVAVFRSLKNSWRNVLNIWKSKNRGVIPKALFPSLLKSAVEQVGEKMMVNIKSGFKACGIIPLARESVLKKLLNADKSKQNSAVVLDTFISYLETKRSETSSDKRSSRSSNKLKIEPGNSVSIEDVDSFKKSELEKGKEKKKRGRPTKILVENENAESLDEVKEKRRPGRPEKNR